MAVALTALALPGVSFAKTTRMAKAGKWTPNCLVKGKKHHYKNKSVCEKKKGKWIAADAMKNAAPAADATAAPANAETK